MGTWYCNGAVYDNVHGEDIFKTSGDYVITYRDDNGCETTKTYKVTCSTPPPQPTECTCENANIANLVADPAEFPANGSQSPTQIARFKSDCENGNFTASVVETTGKFLNNISVIPGTNGNYQIIASVSGNPVQGDAGRRTNTVSIKAGTSTDPCTSVTITQLGANPTPVECNCSNANIVTTPIALDAGGSGNEYVAIAKFTSDCNNEQFTATTSAGGFLDIQENVEIGTGEYIIKAKVAENTNEGGRDQTVNIWVHGDTTTPCVNDLVIYQNGTGIRTCNNNVTSFGSRCDENGKPIPTITFNMSEMWNACGAHNKIQYVVMRGSSLISAYGFDMDAYTPEITQDLSRVSLPGEVTVSWSNFVSDAQVSVKGENTGTIPEWRKDYIKVDERNSKLFCDGNYKISAELMDGTASTETVKEHLTDDQIAQMITIDPVIDTPLEPRQHTITLSNQNVCPVSWNFTPTCNTYTVITDWKQVPSDTLDPPDVWVFSHMPKHVYTSISANVRIERDGVDITSQCGYVKFYFYAFTLSGTFARCDYSSYDYIFEKGEHVISDCASCPVCTVTCDTDYTLENRDGSPKDADTYAASANFLEDVRCTYGCMNPMSGNYFYVQAVKFWYATDGRWITVNFPAKSNTGSAIA